MTCLKEYSWEKIDAVIEDAISSNNAKSQREIIVSTVDGLDYDCGLEDFQEQVKKLAYRIFDKFDVSYDEIITVKYIKYGQIHSDYRRWMELFTTELLVRKNGLTDNALLIRDILNYMSKNIENTELSLNGISEKFNVSYSHLSRLFKQCIGRSYGDLLSDMRLVYMMKYLFETPLKDRDIGLKIGIDDPHYLSIWFKKMMGYSVSEYRKKYLIA